MLFLKSVDQNNKRIGEREEVGARFSGGERRSHGRNFILSFSKPYPVEAVGVKNAALAELAGLPEASIPDGFILSADAYYSFLRRNRLVTPISQALEDLDPDNVSQLIKTTRRIRKWITHGHYPDDLKREIAAATAELLARHSGKISLAVRGSLTVEDVPVASLYSGQQSACLNLHDAQGVLKACRYVFASLFSERAVAYCMHQGLNPLEIAVAVGVQEMIRSDLAVAGVNFSFEPQTGFDQVISVSSSYGLGDNIGQGRVNPDEFLVSRTMLARGFAPIIKRQLGSKQTRTVCSDRRFPATTELLSVPPAERKRFSLTDDEVCELARLTMAVEDYCRQRDGRRSPVSVEWAKDGLSDRFYIVQVCSEKVRSPALHKSYTEYRLLESGWTLAAGAGIGHKIVTGVARVVTDSRDLESLQQGEILVAPDTSRELEAYFDRVSAVVTDRGGRCCHSAALSQKFDVPAVLGCGGATTAIRSGDEITVACIERNMGYVYEGHLRFSRVERPASNLRETLTDLSLVISNPEMAFEYASLPADGVGLVKMEYLINSHIKAHPRAILEYEGQAPEVQFRIDDLVSGYPGRRAFYVDKLAEGIAMIAAAFYPRPVRVRTSDFKSNEYAALYAGEFFEAHELNPIIGLRGAARYFSPEFRESFALECEAIRTVREHFGFTNVEVVIPFVRTVSEGRMMIDLMASSGLERGGNGLKVHFMCETPANALQADEFLEYFDGLVLGANDLAQLTVGFDRDSHAFHDYGARDKAVLKLMYLAIEACQQAGKRIGICGSEVTRYPELVRWLVEKNVHDIAFPPEEFFNAHRLISEIEQARDNSPERKPELSVARSA